MDRLGLRLLSYFQELAESPERPAQKSPSSAGKRREHIHLDAFDLRNHDGAIKPLPLRQQGTHAEDPRELGTVRLRQRGPQLLGRAGLVTLEVGEDLLGCGGDGVACGEGVAVLGEGDVLEWA